MNVLRLGSWVMVSGLQYDKKTKLYRSVKHRCMVLDLTDTHITVQINGKLAVIPRGEGKFKLCENQKE